MSELAELALPRAVPDTHCESMAEAVAEAGRRRARATHGAVTRIRKSPYGGYVVVSIPAKALVRTLRWGGGGFLVSGPYDYGEAY